MKSEGVRRLSFLLGVIGVLVWSGVIIVATAGFSDIDRNDIIVGLVGVPISFFVPFGLVRGIAWVIDGFKSGNK